MEKVSILMAVYRPNKDWLREQLSTLEMQTYDDLELYIADDSPDEPVGESFFSECLHRIPFTYYVHNKQLGTTKTYEELISYAKGDFIFFCDQDDRWRPNKIEKTVTEMKKQNGMAAYCTASVIDGRGIQTAADVREVRTADRFIHGSDISEKLFVVNCVYGCMLTIPTKLAKEALPFPDGVTFDHWLSLYASIYGALVFVEEPLMEYRIHGGNQSRPLKGIETKEQYKMQRIEALKIRAHACLERFRNMSIPQQEKKTRLCALAEQTENWATARMEWANHHVSAFPRFVAGRNLSPRAFLFELAMPFLPKCVFQKAMSFIGKGK